MSFNLIKQRFGTSEKTVIFELDKNIKANDFCYLSDKGFFIATDVGVGLLTNEGQFILPYIANIYNPQAIYYQKQKQNFYVVDGYRDLKYFSSHNSNGFNVMGEKNKKVFDKYLSKTQDDNCVVDCSADSRGNVYYIHSGLNRCLKVNGMRTLSFMGNGKHGFSVSTKLNDCMVSNPSGVCCKGKDIYISDNGNNCIRNISKDNKSRIAITSVEGRIQPSKIVINGELVYYIDENSIKYSTIANSDNGNVYKSEDNIVSLDVGDDRSLYVLSEVKDAV